MKWQAAVLTTSVDMSKMSVLETNLETKDRSDWTGTYEMLQ